MQMLCTVFACMTWPDSTVCHKATRLAMSFVREVSIGAPGSFSLLFAVVETILISILFLVQIFFSFVFRLWLFVTMSLKQRKIIFEPKITLNRNMHALFVLWNVFT